MLIKLILPLFLIVGLALPSFSYANNECKSPAGENRKYYAFWEDTKAACEADSAADPANTNGSCSRSPEPPYTKYCSHLSRNLNTTTIYTTKVPDVDQCTLPEEVVTDPVTMQWTCAVPVVVDVVCTAPEFRDPATNTCIYDGPPTECINGVVLNGTCYPDDSVPDSCDRPIGVMNGQEICGDDQDACKAIGGTYGFINDEPVCITGEQDPFVCPAGTYPVTAYNGDVSCTQPDTPEEPILDPTTPPPATGCPDDLDCDGEPDITDTLPDDYFNGACDPTDTRYAECVGQVLQIEETVAEKLILLENFKAGEITDKFEANAILSLGVEVGSQEEPSFLAGMFTGVFTQSSCTDHVIMIQGAPLTISCSALLPLRQFLAFVVSYWTLLYCWGAIMAPNTVRSKS